MLQFLGASSLAEKVMNWWADIPRKLRLTARNASAHHGESPETAYPSGATNAPEYGTLEAYLQTQPHLPVNSMIAGMGKDGLPFIIDLSHPLPGSMLILGDDHCGKSQLLKAMFTSATRLNPAEQVRLFLLADHPQQFMNLFHLPHCAMLRSTHGQRGPAAISQLYEESLQRRQRRGARPIILLGLDNLASCLSNLETHAHQHLHWLIKHGAKYAIWTVATLSTSRLKDVHVEFFNAFRTRIYGAIASRSIAAQVGGPPPNLAQKLLQGRHFALPYGEGWEMLYPLLPEASARSEPREVNPREA